MYREYTIMQPLQRSYAITEERIENMIQSGALSKIYDANKVFAYENSLEPLKDKEKKALEEFYSNKEFYDTLIQTLKDNCSDTVYLSESEFLPVIKKVLDGYDKKLIEKVVVGLSVMDKNAEIKRDKKGNIIYDKETKDSEIVKYEEDIDTYMAREVLPYLPDAKAFFEENLTAKKKVIKTGAEIPFTRYFYKYQKPEASEVLAKKFTDLEESVRTKVDKLF